MNRLKAVLAEQQKTNRWLAAEINKDESTVSKWCTNTSQPSVEVLYLISEALQIDVRELLISNSTKK